MVRRAVFHVCSAAKPSLKIRLLQETKETIRTFPGCFSSGFGHMTFRSPVWGDPRAGTSQAKSTFSSDLVYFSDVRQKAWSGCDQTDHMSLKDTRRGFLVFLWFPERTELGWETGARGMGEEGKEAPSPPGTVTRLRGSEGRDQDTASTRTWSRNSAIVLCDIQVEVLPGQHTHSPLWALRFHGGVVGVSTRTRAQGRGHRAASGYRNG